MRPDRVRAGVVGWVRLYTRGLPRPVAHRRVEEIEADLHDQVVHERSLGIADRRIARQIASRMIRGAVADVAWRAHEAHNARRNPNKEDTMEHSTRIRSAARIGGVVLAILAIPFNDVEWSVTDFVLAGTLLAIIGVCIEAAVRRRGNLLLAGLVGSLGVFAAIIGELDDAPGLVLIGAAMIAGGVAVAHRRLQSTP
jgi:uncharacterized membrane protein YccC